MNRAIIFGRLGADPTLRETKAGPVLSFRVATTERHKVGDQWQDRTEWHGVVMFGKRAEALSRLLVKGSSVLVEGALRTSSWEKDGQKRERTEIAASNITLAGNKREQPAHQPRPVSDSDAVDWGNDLDADRDLPF